MNHMRSHLVVSSTFVAVFLAALVPCAKFARAEMRTADSPDGFTRAVGAAQPGDEIVIPNGRYSNWNVVLNCSGTEEQPIIVRAEDAHEVVFTEKASFRITGKHIVIRGLAFQDLDLETSPIRLANAQSCRVTECRFTGLQGSAAVVHFEGPAAHNRVDHCKFMQIKTRSVQLRIREDSLKEGPPLSNRIDHNLFQDVPRKGSNGRETIQIGSDQKAYGHIEPKTLVKDNVFLRCDGETEIISNKSSSNIFRGNLFKDCRGELTLRGGHRCLVESNRFEGCDGGVRVLGTGHRLLNNVIIDARDTGIRIASGHTREQGGLNQAAGACLIANNTVVNAGKIGIWLGSVPSEQAKAIADRPIAPYENRVVNNIVSGSAGILLKVDRSPDNEVRHNLLFAVREAEAGTAGEKGVFDDPRFVDAQAGDFRVKPDSPAIGVGIALDSDGGTANIGAEGKATQPWSLPE